MFSPAIRKPRSFPEKGRNAPVFYPDSPSTPNASTRTDLPPAALAVPDRPATGTPAPWASGLSVLARIPSSKKTGKGADDDQTRPVYVGEFPQVVRDAQAKFLQKSSPCNEGISGGIDRASSLCWMVCGKQVFVWSYLTPVVSQKCVILELPSTLESGDHITKFRHGNNWILCVIKWNDAGGNADNVVRQFNSAGIVLCNRKTKLVVYWPDIYSVDGKNPILSIFSSDESKITASPGSGKAANRHQQLNWNGNNTSTNFAHFNCMIASAIPGASQECIALACRSNGELWQFQCTPSGISWQKVSLVHCPSTFDGDNGHSLMNKGYPRSLVWRQHQFVASDGCDREFLLLTDNEIQCWNIQLHPKINISRLWAHEIICSDGDLGIKKDLAGQKQIWLLDLQVDERGREFTILFATFCKDRVSSSSYMQYSLLTMQYKPSSNSSHEDCNSVSGRVLEKKAPIQVIIPKARVEDEDFLLSMRLCVGGKPSGSSIILSPDGTATVTNYWRGSTRLYPFDLPWDAGKALDASVFPSMEDNEEGAWVVLTERAGVWAIPENAVLLGGVEPPERSLSRKGSSNGGTSEVEKRSLAFGSNFAPRRATSEEAWDSGNRQRPALAISRATGQDEEAEALLGRFFHDFVSTGQVEGSFEKLKNSGAFEKDGEINIFARTSKSIVDTLAKHWTTTRGAEIVALAIVSSQLLEKQQKHQKFLHFLALSKCHEELYSRQSMYLLPTF
ncbi:hypothetical protein ACLOJK_000691 [Asimina triloba]